MANSKIKQILVGTTTYDIEDSGAAHLSTSNTFTNFNEFKDIVRVDAEGYAEFGDLTMPPAALRIEKASNVAIATQYGQAVSGTCSGYIFSGTFTPEGSNIRNVKVFWTTGVGSADQASHVKYNSSTNKIEYLAHGSSAAAKVAGTVTYTADITSSAWQIKHHSESGMDFVVRLPNKSGNVVLDSDIVEVVPNTGDTAAAALTSLKIGSTTYSIPSGSSSSGITSVTTTGSGNAVTSASISGNKLTLTKGSTFLTAHQSLTSCAKLSANNTFTGTNEFSHTIVTNAGSTGADVGLKVMVAAAAAAP